MSDPEHVKPCRVFVLEDDAAIRGRLCELLSAAPEFEVCGEAGSLAEASARRDAALVADVLLVDLNLPDGNGQSLIGEAVAWQPRPRIAVISSLGDERSVVSAIEAGVDGYLLKDFRPDELIAALDALVRGESPISPAIARHLLKRFRPDAATEADDNPLSARETEVLGQVARGYTYAEIAEALGITRHTVISHVRHVYEKLNVHSRAQAVHEAASRGLIRIGS